MNWKTKEINGEDSLTAAIQVFSDESKTSLKAGAIMVYPLHITTVNFIQGERKEPISKTRTLVAHLPVCSMQTSGHDRLPRTEPGRTKFGCEDILRALHESIEYILPYLTTKCSSPDFLGTTVDKQRLRLHSIICTYISDTPEAEEMVVVKRDNLTNMPHFQCFSEKKTLCPQLIWKDQKIEEFNLSVGMIS